MPSTAESVKGTLATVGREMKLRLNVPREDGLALLVGLGVFGVRKLLAVLAAASVRRSAAVHSAVLSSVAVDGYVALLGRLIGDVVARRLLTVCLLVAIATKPNAGNPPPFEEVEENEETEYKSVYSLLKSTAHPALPSDVPSGEPFAHYGVASVTTVGRSTLVGAFGTWFNVTCLAFHLQRLAPSVAGYLGGGQPAAGGVGGAVGFNVAFPTNSLSEPFPRRGST
ncbi:hypothetical protein DIPPA_34669 [Diplonema papillatum]|nr:hypothetical protein DIPPA_34669 [Diplonema papillatum]